MSWEFQSVPLPDTGRCKRNLRKELTAERLRELLSYDPDTGVFTWRVKPSKKIVAGTVAGSRFETYRFLASGCRVIAVYRSIGLENVDYLAHRLAWLYIKGCWPEGQLDHRNGDTEDNSFLNLREATNSQNRCNQQNLRSDNTSGVRGVTWNKESKKWKVRVHLEGKNYYLGHFVSLEEATAARQAKARELHGEFYSG